jgi:hypothetical protein
MGMPDMADMADMPGMSEAEAAGGDVPVSGGGWAGAMGMGIAMGTD